MREATWSSKAFILAITCYAPAAYAAWPDDPFCGGSYGPPECQQIFPFQGFLTEQRLEAGYAAACPGNDIIIRFWARTGIKYSPALFLHGGGAGQASYHADDAHGHDVNPYDDIANDLAHAGFVVIEPLLPTIGPNSKPYYDAATVAGIVECVSQMATPPAFPGDPDGCTGGPGTNYPCLTDLGMAWKKNAKENLVIVGHSAGAIVGLYLPYMLKTAVKAMILIDPAKDAYLEQPPMLSMSGTTTPIIHIYPDWYGPFQNSQNLLFRLGAQSSCQGGICVGGPNPGMPCSTSYSSMACGEGYCTDQMGCYGAADCPGGTCTGPAPTKGPWVPIGVRDYPGCNPDQGCHESTHCSALGSAVAYGYQQSYPPSDRYAHHAWCGSGAYDPFTGTTCTKVTPNCPAGQFCSPTSFCNKNIGQASNWRRHRNIPLTTPDAAGYGTRASSIFRRYVKSYAACMGGTFSGYMSQQWVTGWNRTLNDTGGADLCTDTNGVITPTCSAYTTQNACVVGNCLWNTGYDLGRVIRLHNGETVTEYTTTTGRYYGAEEGFNPATGSFVEKQERLGTTTASPNYISCQSGPGLY